MSCCTNCLLIEILFNLQSTDEVSDETRVISRVFKFVYGKQIQIKFFRFEKMLASTYLAWIKQFHSFPILLLVCPETASHVSLVIPVSCSSNSWPLNMEHFPERNFVYIWWFLKLLQANQHWLILVFF